MGIANPLSMSPLEKGPEALLLPSLLISLPELSSKVARSLRALSPDEQCSGWPTGRIHLAISPYETSDIMKLLRAI